MLNHAYWIFFCKKLTFFHKKAQKLRNCLKRFVVEFLQRLIRCWGIFVDSLKTSFYGFFFHFHCQYFIVALESYWCLLLQNLIKPAKPAKSSQFLNLLVLSQKIELFSKKLKNCVITWKGLLLGFCKDWFDVEESLWIPWKHLFMDFFSFSLSVFYCCSRII